MMTILSVGGPFMLFVLVVGLATLAANVALFVRRDRRLVGVVVGLAAATLLVGICGTSMGLYMMSTAFPLPAEVVAEGAVKSVALLSKATGVAHTTTAIGALLAALNAVVCGVGYARAR